MKIITDYYSNLFTSTSLSSMTEILDCLPSVVTNDMNEKLACDFMEWEVLAALKQMVALKAPGPDSMPPLFYQHFWPMMDHDVTQSIYRGCIQVPCLAQ